MSNVHPLPEGRTPLAFALRYATLLGWHVLPLAPGTKKPLGRLVPNGFHDATTDPDIIRTWWAACPDAGIGIAVKASGLVVVDIDPRNGGLLTMERLEAEHGELHSDVLAYTGGGGEHRVFAAQIVEHLPGTLGPGVDLKADGYIAVEPTFASRAEPAHLRPYAWEASSDPLDGVVPTTLPGWIRDLARRPLGPSTFSHTATAPPIAPDRLASLLQALGHLSSDPRETWLNCGMAIHNEMPGAEGFEIWAEWSQRSAKYDPQDQLRVWRSFKRRGLDGTTLNSIFAAAQRAGWKNAPPAPAAMPDIPPESMLLDVLELDARHASVTWAVKGMVPAASVGMLFGASGSFKSFIGLDYSCHRAWSLAWCGRRTKPGTPVFIAAEGGAGLIRRIKAWHQARQLDWRQCSLQVVIVPLLLLGQAEALAQAIRLRGIEPSDIVVDTLSQTFDGNENAADEISGYLRSLRTHLAEPFGCTVTVIHHSGHSATERPRGSSAIQANVDFLFGVFRQGDDSMVATLECHKIKDGERFKPVDFTLSTEQLGTDEDGDPITSLVATHVDNAGAVLAADQGKKEGHRAMLIRLVPAHGIDERELKKLFYSGMEDALPDTRLKSFVRSLNWALENGLLTKSMGYLMPTTEAPVNASKDAQEAAR